MKLKHKILLLIIMALVLVSPVALAQETPPPTTPVVIGGIDLDVLFSELDAYLLLHVVVLAGALQAGINLLKPYIEPLGTRFWAKESVEYQRYFEIVRLLITVGAYLAVWGGVVMTRTFIPSLAILPDVFVGVATVLLVVAGEEIQHGLIQLIYDLRKAKSAFQPPAPALR
jgi:hypothetical protein